jgi:hypothetical protein
LGVKNVDDAVELIKSFDEKNVSKNRAELLKGRILGSRIPDIFEENSGHFCLRPKIF